MISHKYMYKIQSIAWKERRRCEDKITTIQQRSTNNVQLMIRDVV